MSRLIYSDDEDEHLVLRHSSSASDLQLYSDDEAAATAAALSHTNWELDRIREEREEMERLEAQLHQYHEREHALRLVRADVGQVRTLEQDHEQLRAHELQLRMAATGGVASGDDDALSGSDSDGPLSNLRSDPVMGTIGSGESGHGIDGVRGNTAAHHDGDDDDGDDDDDNDDNDDDDSQGYPFYTSGDSVIVHSDPESSHSDNGGDSVDSSGDSPFRDRGAAVSSVWDSAGYEDGGDPHLPHPSPSMSSPGDAESHDTVPPSVRDRVRQSLSPIHEVASLVGTTGSARPSGMQGGSALAPSHHNHGVGSALGLDQGIGPNASTRPRQLHHERRLSTSHESVHLSARVAPHHELPPPTDSSARAGSPPTLLGPKSPQRRMSAVDREAVERRAEMMGIPFSRSMTSPIVVGAAATASVASQGADGVRYAPPRFGSPRALTAALRSASAEPSRVASPARVPSAGARKSLSPSPRAPPMRRHRLWSAPSLTEAYSAGNTLAHLVNRQQQQQLLRDYGASWDHALPDPPSHSWHRGAERPRHTPVRQSPRSPHRRTSLSPAAAPTVVDAAVEPVEAMQRSLAVQSRALEAMWDKMSRLRQRTAGQDTEGGAYASMEEQRQLSQQLSDQMDTIRALTERMQRMRSVLVQRAEMGNDAIEADVDDSEDEGEDALDSGDDVHEDEVYGDPHHRHVGNDAASWTPHDGAYDFGDGVYVGFDPSASNDDEYGYDDGEAYDESPLDYDDEEEEEEDDDDKEDYDGYDDYTEDSYETNGYSSASYDDYVTDFLDGVHDVIRSDTVLFDESFLSLLLVSLADVTTLRERNRFLAAVLNLKAGPQQRPRVGPDGSLRPQLGPPERVPVEAEAREEGLDGLEESEVDEEGGAGENEDNPLLLQLANQCKQDMALNDDAVTLVEVLLDELMDEESSSSDDGDDDDSGCTDNAVSFVFPDLGVDQLREDVLKHLFAFLFSRESSILLDQELANTLLAIFCKYQGLPMVPYRKKLLADISDVLSDEVVFSVVYSHEDAVHAKRIHNIETSAAHVPPRMRTHHYNLAHKQRQRNKEKLLAERSDRLATVAECRNPDVSLNDVFGIREDNVHDDDGHARAHVEPSGSVPSPYRLGPLYPTRTPQPTSVLQTPASAPVALHAGYTPVSSLSAASVVHQSSSVPQSRRVVRPSPSHVYEGFDLVADLLGTDVTTPTSMGSKGSIERASDVSVQLNQSAERLVHDYEHLLQDSMPMSVSHGTPSSGPLVPLSPAHRVNRALLSTFRDNLHSEAIPTSPSKPPLRSSPVTNA